jgi:hypothetical protein
LSEEESKEMMTDRIDDLDLCKNALNMYNIGASNPSGILLYLSDNIQKLCGQYGHNAINHPAITLILYQLSYLNGLIFMLSNYQDKRVDYALKYCLARVEDRICYLPPRNS